MEGPIIKLYPHVLYCIIHVSLTSLFNSTPYSVGIPSVLRLKSHGTNNFGTYLVMDSASIMRACSDRTGTSWRGCSQKVSLRSLCARPH